MKIKINKVYWYKDNEFIEVEDDNFLDELTDMDGKYTDVFLIQIGPANFEKYVAGGLLNLKQMKKLENDVYISFYETILNKFVLRAFKKNK